MDREVKQLPRLDANEKQRLVSSVQVMIAMLEKANLAGGFTLKDSAEIIQAVGTVSQFVNGPLQHL